MALPIRLSRTYSGVSLVCLVARHSEARYGNIPNDELKYFLPELWPTNIILTSNISELRLILKLRSAPVALKEFRDLANELFEAVPEQFRYLLQD